MSVIRKEEIFEISKRIAMEEGLSKLTIRNLASEAGISIGSVYNLFGTKDALVMELIEYYWSSSLLNIIAESKTSTGDFVDRLETLYISFKSASDKFHEDWIKDVFTIHMSNPDIVKMSDRYKKIIEERIEEFTKEETSLKDYFDDDFTMDELADFIFENMMLLLRKNSPDLGFFKIILRRIIYG